MRASALRGQTLARRRGVRQRATRVQSQFFDPSRWYIWASAFFVLQGTEALGVIDRLVYGGWAGKPGDKITQSLNLIFIATSLSLFCRGLHRAKSVRTGASVAIGFIGFLFFSSFWSIDSQMTIREAVLYLFVVIGAIGIATNLEGDEYMEVLALISCITAAISLFLLVADPTVALTEDGDFRGIFSQKNVIGEAMTMGALASLHLLRVGKRSKVHSAGNLVVVSTAAIMSRSATSCLTILAFGGTDAIICLIGKRGAYRVLAIVGIVFLVPIMVAAALFPDSILEIIGKDPTLTGRTELWDYVIADIYQRPLIGWGYMAFWSTNNPAAIEISDTVHWFVPQAHNGLLEILLNVGVVGALFFVFLWAGGVALSFACMRTAKKALATSCLMSCIGIVLIGMSETVMIVPFQATTSVFFILGLCCERALRTAREGRRRTARWGLSRSALART